MSRPGEIGINLLGAIAGATIGSAAFYLLLKQGFYALVLPGACLGLGIHVVAERQSLARGILAGVAALALGLLLEWWFLPWVADGSLLYFLKNIPRLKVVTLLMIAVGAIFAVWWGRDSRPRRSASNQSPS